jgi:hypothetical protein
MMAGAIAAAGRSVDELCRHPNPIAGSANTTFQYIADTEFSTYKAGVNRFTAEREAGVAGNNEQPAQFCQVSQNVFGNAVAEIFLVWIAGQVCEGQDGD